MTMESGLVVCEVRWQAAEAALRSIRTQVFIVEQRVPQALEWDGMDQDAIHFLAYRQSQPVACARLLHGGQIGRMAVLAGHRGQGIGMVLLQAALAACRVRGWHEVSLSAQTHAVDFYAQAGFAVSSGEYLDAGILHRDMKLILSS